MFPPKEILFPPANFKEVLSFVSFSTSFKICFFAFSGIKLTAGPSSSKTSFFIESNSFSVSSFLFLSFFSFATLTVFSFANSSYFFLLREIPNIKKKRIETVM